MSFDRYWLCPTLDPKTWINNLNFDEFSVGVIPGGPGGIDELYRFRTLEDAIAFYAQGVEDREFVNESGLALGFDEVSLRVLGKIIAVRSKPARTIR